ncbi:MAG: APC family permease [Ktedonobacteraceae bacterium]
MTQKSVAQETAQQGKGDEHSHGGNLLGPLLCWAVVFADIGTSVYYTPGILYGTVGKLAGFFVFLTMAVFVLLTLKYAEVTHRFPQGGGVVTVAAQAINRWVGALGGMFILVDYFLTAAISCFSGLLYFSVVFHGLEPLALWLTVGVLVLLGVLNWVGISESAKVSFVGAVVAFISDIAILFTVFTHMSFGQFLALFPAMFSGRSLPPSFLLAGFAGSFLAFSGLESISQLSPVMKTPRKKVAGLALLLVVLTIGLTSPLLTMLSTLLQPTEAHDAIKNTQLISLLAGHWGNAFLQTEVAISASALLIFASNTAIIGSYHVFMALSRMEFFPAFVLRRNKLRGTPHYSIALATAIPIAILLLVKDINVLGDMYAFGLLGAFTLTCLGLDLVRFRERRALRAAARYNREAGINGNDPTQAGSAGVLDQTPGSNGQVAANGAVASVEATIVASTHKLTGLRGLWYTLDFWLGVLTTILVLVAWLTNLVDKPLATLFGGGVTLVGMSVAYANHRYHTQRGRPSVSLSAIEGRVPDAILAVLTNGDPHNEDVVRSAIHNADGKPVLFLYVGQPTVARPARIFEMVDPFLEDEKAKDQLGRAEALASKAKISRRYLYRQNTPGAVASVWQIIHPHDTVMAADQATKYEDINPDRIRYEITPHGQVAHMLKRW